MNQSFFFRITLLVVATLGLTFSYVLNAQHLFSVSYNELSQENVAQLKTQIASMQIPPLSSAKNNNSDLFSVDFSSGQHAKIIILNEQTGAHVLITPAEESLTEFQIVPFFIEELKQATLGEAIRYLVMETNLDLSVRSVASISTTTRDVYIPQYFYGKKENVKEAFPEDRQIIHIFKEKPRFIPASNDPEILHQIAQLEEAMCYYVYMYRLPNGVLTIYDEHFNPEGDKSECRIDGIFLPFTLSHNNTMNAEKITATEYAFELWGEQLAGTVPVNARIEMKPLSGNTLGQAFRQRHFFDTIAETWYHSPLWNQMVGYAAASGNDIRIEMNSNASFYFGLDANPPSSSHDYVTILLHELSHGLGFAALCGENGRYTYTSALGTPLSTDYPGTFDRQLFQGTTGPALADLTQSERAALVISNNLYAGAPGSNLLAANNGARVRMYAPLNDYQGGSSVSHWFPSVNFPNFMGPAAGTGASNALHTFNNRKIGIFSDMGWPLPNPSSYVSITFIPNNDESEDVLEQRFIPNVEKKLRPNSFFQHGYTFKDWNTEEDGTGISYADRELISITNNMVLFAQWEPSIYTLTFNPDGGTVNPTSKQVRFNLPIGELPIPVKQNNIFQRWVIITTEITEEMIWRYAEDFTAKAIWKVGVNDIKADNSIQIVPNPASHTIELRIMNYVQGQIDQIEIYNIFGQLVKSVPFSGQTLKDSVTQKINIFDLNAGIYMVKVGEKTVKLVKNN